MSTVFKVGDRVEAKQGGNWLPGIIAGYENSCYQVRGFCLFFNFNLAPADDCLLLFCCIFV